MFAVLLVLGGCGTTLNRSATEQMLTSDAVDRSVARIDFHPLAGQKVFLDVDYIRNVKGVGSVNSEYVISSLRQQLLAAGCLLQEGKAQCDYVVEVRVGALGLDANEVIYGIPANNALGAASSLVATVPAAPVIPELALAKKNDQRAAAKIGAFAYHRLTREVVWQSGTSESISSSRDSWIAGVGPFQSGNIRKETRFAPAGGLLPIGSSGNDLPSDVKFSETKTYKELTPPPPPSVAATTTPAPATPPPAVAAAPATLVKNDFAIAEIPLDALEEMPRDVATALLIPGQTLIPIPAPLSSAPLLKGSRPMSALELESHLLEDEFAEPDRTRIRRASAELVPEKPSDVGVFRLSPIERTPLNPKVP